VLAKCPAVTVLATSRVVLGICGEHVCQVTPLDVAASSDLFVDRARLARTDFEVSDCDRVVIAEICERLDRLPLAIELTAAWTRVLTPSQLLDRLDSALPPLSAGGQATTDRQETMAATVTWSYRLLAPEDRELFDLLSVFAGSFDLAAVQTVGGSADDDVLVGLASLVDHSLVVSEPAGDEMRYRLLEPIRQCAEAGLIASGEEDTARRRHAEHYLDVATRCDRDLLAGRRGEALRTLERDEPNLVAALQWAKSEGAELGLRLAAALGLFWEIHGRVNDGRAWLDEMLMIDTTDRGVRSIALYRAANLAWQQRDDPSARGMLQESLAIEREFGDDDLGVACGRRRPRLRRGVDSLPPRAHEARRRRPGRRHGLHARRVDRQSGRRQPGRHGSLRALPVPGGRDRR
jgi:predicted ATPase